MTSSSTKDDDKGPSRWDGSEESWLEWRFEFVNWSRRHRHDAPTMLQTACETTNIASISVDSMDEAARALAGKIMTDLALKTSGPAKRLLMSLAESERDNGFIGFRELARRAESGSGLRATTLLSSILRFDFSGKDFRDKMVQFESLCNQYNNQQGPDQQLGDNVKVSVVANGATGELRRQLQARASSFPDYQSMRRYVLDFLDAQRLYQGPNAHKPPRKDPDAMDIDGAFADWKGKGKHDGKSKGKQSKGDKNQKGKGTAGKDPSKEKPFQGYCGTCGKWGHKSSACYYNPSNGKSGRPGAGKGKNGKEGKGTGTGTGTASGSAEGTAATLYADSGWVFSIQAHEEDPGDSSDMTEVVVDSGASRTATQWGFGHGDVETKQGGPVLRSVDGTAIRQYGERHMWAEVTDNNGQALPIALRSIVADVSKNVLSVANMNEVGNSVIFPACGHNLKVTDGDVEVELSVPCIVRAGSSQVVPLQRKNGVFVLPMRACAEDKVLAALGHDDAETDAGVENPPDPPPGLAVAEVVRPNIHLGKRSVNVVPEVPVPDEADVRHHLATGHAEYAPWCAACIGGRGREAKHSRVDPSQRHIPHIHMDYGYFTLGGGAAASRMRDVRYSVFLVATDNSSGEVFASIVKRKGRGEVYTATKLALWLERLGHPQVVVVTDTEAPMRSMAKAILKELRKRVQFKVGLRAVPRGSSASNGAAEQSVHLIASSVRTLLWDLDLEALVEPDDRILAWLVPYCAWSHNRFCADANGVTPYEKATGQRYHGTVVPFASWVMLKHDKPSTKHRSKLRSQWSLGLWLGKSELNDSHFVSCSSGVRTGRTVRVVPRPRATPTELKALKGVPWNVKEGIDEPDVVESVPLHTTPEPRTGAEHNEEEVDQDAVSASDSAEEMGEVPFIDEQTGLQVVAEASSDLVRAAEQRATTATTAAARENIPIPSESVPPVPVGTAVATAGPTSGIKREATEVIGESRPLQVARVETPRGVKRTGESTEGSPPSWRRLGHERYEVEAPTPVAPVVSTEVSTTVMEDHGETVNALWLTSRMEVHEYGAQCESLVCTVFEKDGPLDAGEDWEISPTEDQLMKDVTLWQEEPEASVVFKPLTAEEITAARVEDLKKIAEFDGVVPFDRHEAEKIDGAIWLTDRWVDTRKNEGEARSRWVLREFNGGDGDLDYFSSTPDPIITEAVHAYALKYGKDLVYCDISRAFMHSPEERWVFVEPPREAYREDAPASIRVREGQVYMCKRKINGRRDGPQAYGIYSQVAWKSFGFVTSRLHPSVVYQEKPSEGCMRDLVCMHVDDWVMAVEPNRTDELLEALGGAFVVKESGRLPASSMAFSPWVLFLGRERSRKGNLLLRRPLPKYVEAAAKVLQLSLNCNPAPTPVTVESKKAAEGDLLQGHDRTVFQQALGHLIYVKDDYRLAQFGLQQLAKAMSAPTSSSLASLKRMVRYLIGVRSQCVMMQPTNAAGIDVYADSNWAGGSDRKSVDCNIVKLWGVVLTTSTKQQSFVAQSSAEAELAGGHRATMAALCLKNFLAEVSELCVNATVWMDSKAGLAMLARVGVGRVRHLEVKQLFCQHISASGKVEYKKVKGSSNPADAGTKAFSDVSHFVQPLQIVHDGEQMRMKSLPTQPHFVQEVGAQTKGVLACLAACLLKAARAEDPLQASEDGIGILVSVVLVMIVILWCATSQWCRDAVIMSVCATSQWCCEAVGMSVCATCQNEVGEMANHSGEMANHSAEMENHSGEMANHSAEMANHSGEMENHSGEMANHSGEMENHS
eukprot:3683512-Amphidinium_carterae.1